MHITNLALANYRNYTTANLTVPAGVVTLVGNNGQGKTNLVEALMYLATLSSHRVASDAPLVQSGHEKAHVAATIQIDTRTVQLEAQIAASGRNRLSVNRVPLSRPRDILGTLHIVLFAPEDLTLVKGDPHGRRRFLDDLLCQLSPRFAGVKADYDKVLKQRNTLLKQIQQGSASADLLDIWDDQLVGYGSDICYARLFTCARIQPWLHQAYEALAGTSKACTARYHSAALLAEQKFSDLDRPQLADQLRTALHNRRREEIARGITVVGPHRDDLELGLGSLPAKGYASHGESWSVALALRLASYWLLRDEGNGQLSEREPVLILDDVFAELDRQRRIKLSAVAADAEQAIITAAVPEDLPAELTGAQFQVQSGVVSALQGLP